MWNINTVNTWRYTVHNKYIVKKYTNAVTMDGDCIRLKMQGNYLQYTIISITYNNTYFTQRSPHRVNMLISKPKYVKQDLFSFLKMFVLILIVNNF
jgi:hypothetical protein